MEHWNNESVMLVLMGLLGMAISVLVIYLCMVL